jgi:hypothetical protein
MGAKKPVIFGASGVSGWSFVNEMLHDYPRNGVWQDVYALTNRPITQQESLWPKDDRLHIVCGIDLLKGSQENLEKELKSKISNVESITHVYYLGKILERKIDSASNDGQHIRRIQIGKKNIKMQPTCLDVQ